MPWALGHEQLAGALFTVMNSLFMNGLGTSLKGYRDSTSVMFDAAMLAAAHKAVLHPL